MLRRERERKRMSLPRENNPAFLLYVLLRSISTGMLLAIR